MDSKKPSLVEAGLAKRSGEGGFAQHFGILQPSPLDAACTCCSRHPMLPTPAAAVTSCSCHTLQPSLDAAITRCSRHGQATRTPPRTARNSRPAMRDTCGAPASRTRVHNPPHPRPHSCLDATVTRCQRCHRHSLQPTLDAPVTRCCRHPLLPSLVAAVTKP